ncbi:MAG: hypothetical protein IH899_04790 [Planctomycetes bacterium]|nr:hypothetical protein [Planctomycetota bacterium]
MPQKARTSHHGTEVRHASACGDHHIGLAPIDLSSKFKAIHLRHLNIGQQQRNLSGVSGDYLKEYPRNRPVSRWMARLYRADDTQIA